MTCTFNKEDDFDYLINRALGHYVYALKDPGNSEIFYIGKAGGREGKGNQRVQHHFVEARNWLKKRNSRGSRKIARIIAIWEAGMDVEWFIVRRNLRDEAEALAVEGALIDLLKISCSPDPLNDQGGHHANKNGMLSSLETRHLAAVSIEPGKWPAEITGRKIMLLNVGNSFSGDTLHNAYEATRKAWSFSKGFRNQSVGSIAIGLINGVSLGAWEINDWERVNENPLKWGFNTNGDKAGTKILTKPFNFSPITRHFSVRGYWGRGNPVAVELLQGGAFKVVRGARDKDTSHSLQQ